MKQIDKLVSIYLRGSGRNGVIQGQFEDSKHLDGLPECVSLVAIEIKYCNSNSMNN